MSRAPPRPRHNIPAVAAAERRLVPPAPPPPAPLTLISASFVDTPAAALTLVFDRPINIGGLVPTAILVDDAQFQNYFYDASGGSRLLDPVTLKLLLVEFDNASGPGVRLTAAAGNGVSAVDDGGTWPGVSNLPLPFP